MLETIRSSIKCTSSRFNGLVKNMTDLSTKEKDIIEKYRSLAKDEKAAVKATVDRLYNTTI